MTNEKLWNANYKMIMLNNFALFFSFYLIMPLLPIYLSERFSASKDMIGIVLSGYTIVALIVRPFTGYISDNFVRRNILLVCLFAYFLFFGGYILSGSLLMFAIFRTLHGAPFGATTVTNGTMVIDVLPISRRGEGVGLYGLSNNLATAIAPTIGVFIYDRTHNFELLFWCAFIVAGIGFLNALRLRPPKWSPEGKRPPLSMDRIFLFRGWFIALNLCFFGFCWGILSTYIAIYGKENLHIVGGTGIYFMILSCGLILSRLQGRKALREGKFLGSALKGVLFSTIGFTFFILPHSIFTYYGSALLIGLGNGHFWPAFQNMIISISKENELGTANSTILTSWDLGVGIGVVIGGIVAEHSNYGVSFQTAMLIHVIGLLLFLFLTRKYYLSTLKNFSK